MDPVLSNTFINSYKTKTPPFGFNGLGLIVYRRTYSRLKDDGTNEEWYETVARCINGAQKIGAGYTKEEAERLYDHVFNLRCNFAGRMLWQLGTPVVEKLSANSLLNCWMASINEPKAFLFLFENLMLGGGVGFSVRREDVHELPRIKRGVTVAHLATKDADFIVPDSRQGWIKLLSIVLDAYYVTGKSFTYSTVLVRGAGERINGFGGTASGPQILIDGIQKIAAIFQSREEKKLRSIDALDICNVIGSIVVAGNIRRSAQIALGDPDDFLYLRAKNWSLGNVPNWRAMSNNTIYADSFDHISDEIWQNGYTIDPKTGHAKGEPYGFFNLPLSQRFGRIKDGPLKDSSLYPADKDNCSGTNPCVAPETMLLTRDGYHPIGMLEGQEVEVWNGKQWSKTVVAKTGTNQRLLHFWFEKEELDYDQLEEMWVTPYHRFYLADGTMVEAKDLKEGDRLQTYTSPVRAYDNDNGVKTFVVSFGKSEERYDDTYCVNEPLEHKAVFNGVLTGNCGEISLASYECCNLSELYLNNITSKEQLIDCAKLLYKTQKAIAAMPFLHEETNAIVHKNMRLGLGVTGICQSLDKMDWLDDCYVALRKFDKVWSKERGWPESIKLTTIKPSGCSRKDSLVLTSDGLMRLDEIGDVHGAQWQQVDRLSTHTSNAVSQFYVNGRVKTRILRTEDGFEYESSLNHRYWIDGAWKYVADLKVGDAMTALLGGHNKIKEPRLCTIAQYKITNSILIKQPSHMTPDLAFFVGLFYADGSVHQKGIRISFNRKDNDMICLLRKIVKESFDLEGHTDEDGGFYVNSVFLKEWLETQGVLKDYCHELVLPRVIRQSSVDSVRAFIAGFWRGDGGQHNLSSWSVCSVSRGFVLDLAALMRSVGHNVSIKNAGPGGYGKLDRWIILCRESKPSRYHGTDFKDRFIGENQWSDRVVEIIESECETYDIEVQDSHQYVLNGAVSHNTLSLLGGATPGVHPAYSQFYIRRVRMASSDKLAKQCRDAGYVVEYAKNFDGTENRETVVVEFPCRTPDGAVLAKDMPVLKQLEMVKKLQSIWSDNAVSVTAYYDPEELPALKKWLAENYEKHIKSVSFLLRSSHGFLQAPYEEIDELEYNEMVARVKPIQSTAVSGEMLADLDSCVGGACPIR